MSFLTTMSVRVAAVARRWRALARRFGVEAQTPWPTRRR